MSEDHPPDGQSALWPDASTTPDDQEDLAAAARAILHQMEGTAPALFARMTADHRSALGARLARISLHPAAIQAAHKYHRTERGFHEALAPLIHPQTDQQSPNARTSAAATPPISPHSRLTAHRTAATLAIHDQISRTAAQSVARTPTEREAAKKEVLAAWDALLNSPLPGNYKRVSATARFRSRPQALFAIEPSGNAKAIRAEIAEEVREAGWQADWLLLGTVPPGSPAWHAAVRFSNLATDYALIAETPPPPVRKVSASQHQSGPGQPSTVDLLSLASDHEHQNPPAPTSAGDRAAAGEPAPDASPEPPATPGDAAAASPPQDTQAAVNVAISAADKPAAAPPAADEDPHAIIISHNHAEGTTLHGSVKGDGVLEIVRRHGEFTWSRQHGIFIWGSRGKDAQPDRIAKAVAALRAAGYAVAEPHIDNQPLTAAQREAARGERAIVRAGRLNALAEKAAADSAATWQKSRNIAARRPYGQPILEDHPSAAGHRRDINHMNSLDRKSFEAAARARELAGRAAGVEANERLQSNPQFMMRRIDRMVAARGKWQNGLAEAEKNGTSGDYEKRARRMIATLTEDIEYTKAKLAALEASGEFVAWQAKDFVKGDQVRCGGIWYEVLRVNKKSVTVPTEYSWTNTLPWDKVAGRRRGDVQHDTPNGDGWPAELARKVARWERLARVAERRSGDSSVETHNVQFAQRLVHGLDLAAADGEVTAFQEVVEDTQTTRNLAAAYLEVYDRLTAGERAPDIRKALTPFDVTPTWRLPDTDPEDRRADRAQPGDLVKGVWEPGYGRRTLLRHFAGPLADMTITPAYLERPARVTLTLESGDTYECGTHVWLAVYPAPATVSMETEAGEEPTLAVPADPVATGSDGPAPTPVVKVDEPVQVNRKAVTAQHPAAAAAPASPGQVAPQAPDPPVVSPADPGIEADPNAAGSPTRVVQQDLPEPIEARVAGDAAIGKTINAAPVSSSGGRASSGDDASAPRDAQADPADSDLGAPVAAIAANDPPTNGDGPPDGTDTRPQAAAPDSNTGPAPDTKAPSETLPDESEGNGGPAAAQPSLEPPTAQREHWREAINKAAATARPDTKLVYLEQASAALPLPDAARTQVLDELQTLVDPTAPVSVVQRSIARSLIEKVTGEDAAYTQAQQAAIWSARFSGHRQPAERVKSYKKLAPHHFRLLHPDHRAAIRADLARVADNPPHSRHGTTPRYVTHAGVLQTGFQEQNLPGPGNSAALHQEMAKQNLPPAVRDEYQAGRDLAHRLGGVAGLAFEARRGQRLWIPDPDMPGEFNEHVVATIRSSGRLVTRDGVVLGRLDVVVLDAHPDRVQAANQTEEDQETTTPASDQVVGVAAEEDTAQTGQQSPVLPDPSTPSPQGGEPANSATTPTARKNSTPSGAAAPSAGAESPESAPSPDSDRPQPALHDAFVGGSPFTTAQAIHTPLQAVQQACVKLSGSIVWQSIARNEPEPAGVLDTAITEFTALKEDSTDPATLLTGSMRLARLTWLEQHHRSGQDAIPAVDTAITALSKAATELAVNLTATALTPDRWKTVFEQDAPDLDAVLPASDTGPALNAAPAATPLHIGQAPGTSPVPAAPTANPEPPTPSADHVTGSDTRPTPAAADDTVSTRQATDTAHRNAERRQNPAPSSTAEHTSDHDNPSTEPNGPDPAAVPAPDNSPNTAVAATRAPAGSNLHSRTPRPTAAQTTLLIQIAEHDGGRLRDLPGHGTFRAATISAVLNARWALEDRTAPGTPPDDYRYTITSSGREVLNHRQGPRTGATFAAALAATPPLTGPWARVHTFRTSREAYEAAQGRSEIRDGDVLVVVSEKVVGFLFGTWPVAISPTTGAFPAHFDYDEHNLTGLEGYQDSVATAEVILHQLEADEQATNTPRQDLGPGPRPQGPVRRSRHRDLIEQGAPAAWIDDAVRDAYAQYGDEATAWDVALRDCRQELQKVQAPRHLSPQQVYTKILDGDPREPRTSLTALVADATRPKPKIPTYLRFAGYRDHLAEYGTGPFVSLPDDLSAALLADLASMTRPAHDVDRLYTTIAISTGSRSYGHIPQLARAAPGQPPLTYLQAAASSSFGTGGTRHWLSEVAATVRSAAKPAEPHEHPTGGWRPQSRLVELLLNHARDPKLRCDDQLMLVAVADKIFDCALLPADAPASPESVETRIRRLQPLGDMAAAPPHSRVASHRPPLAEVSAALSGAKQALAQHNDPHMPLLRAEIAAGFRDHHDLRAAQERRALKPLHEPPAFTAATTLHYHRAALAGSPTASASAEDTTNIQRLCGETLTRAQDLIGLLPTSIASELADDLSAAQDSLEAAGFPEGSLRRTFPPGPPPSPALTQFAHTVLTDTLHTLRDTLQQLTGTAEDDTAAYLTFALDMLTPAPSLPSVAAPAGSNPPHRGAERLPKAQPTADNRTLDPDTHRPAPAINLGDLDIDIKRRAAALIDKGVPPSALDNVSRHLPGMDPAEAISQVLAYLEGTTKGKTREQIHDLFGTGTARYSVTELAQSAADYVSGRSQPIPIPERAIAYGYDIRDNGAQQFTQLPLHLQRAVLTDLNNNHAHYGRVARDWYDTYASSLVTCRYDTLKRMPAAGLLPHSYLSTNGMTCSRDAGHIVEQLAFEAVNGRVAEDTIQTRLNKLAEHSDTSPADSFLYHALADLIHDQASLAPVADPDTTSPHAAELPSTPAHRPLAIEAGPARPDTTSGTSPTMPVPAGGATTPGTPPHTGSTSPASSNTATAGKPWKFAAHYADIDVIHALVTAAEYAAALREDPTVGALAWETAGRIGEILQVLAPVSDAARAVLPTGYEQARSAPVVDGLFAVQARDRYRQITDLLDGLPAQLAGPRPPADAALALERALEIAASVHRLDAADEWTLPADEVVVEELPPVNWDNPPAAAPRSEDFTTNATAPGTATPSADPPPAHVPGPVPDAATTTAGSQQTTTPADDRTHDGSLDMESEGYQQLASDMLTARLILLDAHGSPAPGEAAVKALKAAGIAAAALRGNPDLERAAASAVAAVIKTLGHLHDAQVSTARTALRAVEDRQASPAGSPVPAAYAASLYPQVSGLVSGSRGLIEEWKKAAPSLTWWGDLDLATAVLSNLSFPTYTPSLRRSEQPARTHETTSPAPADHRHRPEDTATKGTNTMSQTASPEVRPGPFTAEAWERGLQNTIDKYNRGNRLDPNVLAADLLYAAEAAGTLRDDPQVGGAAKDAIDRIAKSIGELGVVPNIAGQFTPDAATKYNSVPLMPLSAKDASDRYRQIAELLGRASQKLDDLSDITSNPNTKAALTSAAQYVGLVHPLRTSEDQTADESSWPARDESPSAATATARPVKIDPQPTESGPVPQSLSPQELGEKLQDTKSKLAMAGNGERLKYVREALVLARVSIDAIGEHGGPDGAAARIRAQMPLAAAPFESAGLPIDTPEQRPDLAVNQSLGARQRAELLEKLTPLLSEVGTRLIDLNDPRFPAAVAALRAMWQPAHTDASTDTAASAVPAENPTDQPQSHQPTEPEPEPVSDSPDNQPTPRQQPQTIEDQSIAALKARDALREDSPPQEHAAVGISLLAVAAQLAHMADNAGVAGARDTAHKITNSLELAARYNLPGADEAWSSISARPVPGFVADQTPQWAHGQASRFAELAAGHINRAVTSPPPAANPTPSAAATAWVAQLAAATEPMANLSDISRATATARNVSRAIAHTHAGAWLSSRLDNASTAVETVLADMRQEPPAPPPIPANARDLTPDDIDTLIGHVRDLSGTLGGHLNTLSRTDGASLFRRLNLETAADLCEQAATPGSTPLLRRLHDAQSYLARAADPAISTGERDAAVLYALGHTHRAYSSLESNPDHTVADKAATAARATENAMQVMAPTEMRLLHGLDDEPGPQAEELFQNAGNVTEAATNCAAAQAATAASAPAEQASDLHRAAGIAAAVHMLDQIIPAGDTGNPSGERRAELLRYLRDQAGNCSPEDDAKKVVKSIVPNASRQERAWMAAYITRNPEVFAAPPVSRATRTVINKHVASTLTGLSDDLARQADQLAAVGRPQDAARLRARAVIADPTRANRATDRVGRGGLAERDPESARTGAKDAPQRSGGPGASRPRGVVGAATTVLGAVERMSQMGVTRLSRHAVGHPAGPEPGVLDGTDAIVSKGGDLVTALRTLRRRATPRGRTTEQTERVSN